PKPTRINVLLELASSGWKEIAKDIFHKFEKDNVVNDNLLLDEIVNEENEDDNNDEYEITEDERISLDFRNALVSINN
ncbi:7716_t:CDS:2, partial [Entrophospora sp. SA101]